MTDVNTDSGRSAGGRGADSPAGGAAAAPAGAAGAGMRAVLDTAAVQRALTRIAHEILERTQGADDAVLLGIPTRGVHLAAPARRADRRRRGALPVRSAPSTSPCTATTCGCAGARRSAETEIPPGGIDGKLVILVDDVLFSGRTIRAALDALSDLGRPRAVQLAVLVDRGHRELPIRADYVGKNLPTAQRETVQVRLAEIDGQDAVLLGVKEEGAR